MSCAFGHFQQVLATGDNVAVTVICGKTFFNQILSLFWKRTKIRLVSRFNHINCVRQKSRVLHSPEPIIDVKKNYKWKNSKEEMIQARPWVSPEVLFNFGRPELSPWIKFRYFFLYQTSAIFSIMKILDNVCPFSFLWAHHRANHVLRQLMEWDVSRENIQPRTSFTLRSVRVNISKCLEIILDCRKSGRRAGKHIVPSFLTF